MIISAKTTKIIAILITIIRISDNPAEFNLFWRSFKKLPVEAKIPP
jgi:hypothetical protein